MGGLMPVGSARRPRTGKALVAAVLIFAGFASSTAQAQNCGPLGTNFETIGMGDLKSEFGGAIAGATAIAATINAVNTAFLTHSTAFVSAPASPPPDSQGGGVWIRGVGGESTTKSNETISVAVPGFQTNPDPANTNCNSTFKQNFAGVQFGTDISRLNIGGWNVHLGTTAGYLGTTGDIKEGATPTGGPFNTQTQAPFVGTYVAATYGGFFIDALLRYNFYETSLDSPSVNLFHQKIDAHGISIGGSAGYHWVIPNSNWFIEPSAGIVWSRAKVDPLQLAGAPVIQVGGSGLAGSAQINDIINTVGRAGLRVGTQFDYGNMILQPFASVNVYHDFNGDWSANYASCPGCLTSTALGNSQLIASINGSGVGTYGTYSLGVAGQIKNTGWLGYLRVDYTNGNNLEGWTGTGGIRYQFTPEAPRTALITKAPVKAAPGPVSFPVNWTGFYVGGIGGGAFGGHADATFAPAPETNNTFPFPGATSSARLAGILGGGEIGYNYQMGPWVLGLEADLAWTNARGSKACGNLVAPDVSSSDTRANALFNSTCHHELDWLATATGRVGYSWGRALYYVKAGAAWTHEEFSVTCNNGPLNGTEIFDQTKQNCFNPAGNLFNTISASDNRTGWTAGFGAEFALTNNWSAKAETNYLGFGTRGLTLSDGTSVNSKLNFWEAKIGVNYRFTSM
jgi:outer membrane autotransporter protein